MPERIVISGYYGFGNTGDEAVLAGMLESFRQVEIDARVTVLSANPSRTVREHSGIDAANRWRPWSVIRALRGADVFISGGGSLIQDVTSAASSYYYLGVLRLAQMMRRRTMVYAQGIGPLTRAAVRRCASRVLNRVDLITVRDSDSAELLKSIGVTRPPVHLCADPAFLLEPDLERADEILAAKGLAGREVIGVSLRPWPNPPGWKHEVCEGISRAAGEIGAGILEIPMQEPEDAACSGVQGAVTAAGAGGPRVVKGLMSRCALVVGMRLHSLIFAAGETTPFVPVVYDPKVASFADSAGAERVLNIESLSADEVAQAVISVWEKRDQTRETLAGKLDEWKRLALEPAGMVLSGT